MITVDGVALTAFLVNESRVRFAGSRADPFAGAWVPDDARRATQELWERYVEAVYPHDDLIVSLRTEFGLRCIRRAVSQHPDAVLVVLGAGFSSYPWLGEARTAIEVDSPEVVRLKQERAHVLTARGSLPARDVTFVGTDLLLPDGWTEVQQAVAQHDPERPVIVVAEGLVYYLDDVALAAMGRFCDASRARTAASFLTYWPSSAKGNVVLDRQTEWFRTIGIDVAPRFLDAEEVVSIVGRDHLVVSPEEMQEGTGSDVVPEAALIPEYLAIARHG